MSIDIDIDIDNSMNIEQTEWQLSLSSETELENRASTGFPVTCPTLDLAATWDSVTKNVLLYRPPSQVVSKIHQLGPPGTKGPEALAITWKADGMANECLLSTTVSNNNQVNFWLWGGAMALCG